MTKEESPIEEVTVKKTRTRKAVKTPPEVVEAKQEVSDALEQKEALGPGEVIYGVSKRLANPKLRCKRLARLEYGEEIRVRKVLPVRRNHRTKVFFKVLFDRSGK